MTKKTPKTTPKPTARTVYEVRPNGGRPVQLEATSTNDLAGQLAHLLNLDPYGSRAAAHTLHNLRASITTPTWAARRIGELRFVADDQAHPYPTPHRTTQPVDVNTPTEVTTTEEQRNMGSNGEQHG